MIRASSSESSTVDNQRAELKRADLLASVRAGVLGAGLALVLTDYLRAYAVPLLIVGLVSHAWGMYAKHRLELREGQLPERWMGWLCTGAAGSRWASRPSGLPSGDADARWATWTAG